LKIGFEVQNLEMQCYYALTILKHI